VITEFECQNSLGGRPAKALTPNAWLSDEQVKKADTNWKMESSLQAANQLKL
jgi:hypothetical protein